MNNQILHIQNSRISQLQGQNVLKNGSSVYVKVIADKGNGQYLGSVAGNRVNITSTNRLAVGSSFVATIQAKNGVIYITPKNAGPELSQSAYISSQPLQASQLSTILSALGVPVTALSENLAKMMMQLEMKVDGKVLRGLYSAALKFKGKEKAAGEIITLLKDKEIEATDEEIEELLAYLERESGTDEDSANFKQNQFESGKKLVNKINGKDGGWFIVPYNLVSKEDDDVVGAGVIRMLFDNDNCLKKINLNCYFNDREYLFSLDFESKKCKKIRMNVSPADDTAENYEALLGKYVAGVKIEWAEKEAIRGCGSEGEEIISFQGEA